MLLPNILRNAIVMTIIHFCNFRITLPTLGRNLLITIPTHTGITMYVKVIAMLEKGSTISSSPIIYTPNVYIHNGTNATTEISRAIWSDPRI